LGLMLTLRDLCFLRKSVSVLREVGLKFRRPNNLTLVTLRAQFEG
jgi:hypothetical protein